MTHVNVAAIHLNDPPGNITLNDHAPDDPRYITLWAELRILQASGIKVLGMLGGAAKGSFTRLDLDDTTFEAYYIPLRNLVRERNLDGLDLDVEEPMTLAGIIRLIDRLKQDFGNVFLITLAPVAAALMSERPEHNLSGFSYEALEVMRGAQIAWYNTQFYCGWGDLSNTGGYDYIIRRGFPAHKVIVGMVTNPGNGSGWVDLAVLREVLITLRQRYPGFGGVMGWEYFNSLPGDRARPWEWAAFMTRHLRSSGDVLEDRMVVPPTASQVQNPILLLDSVGNKTRSDEDAPLPGVFEYDTDGNASE